MESSLDKHAGTAACLAGSLCALKAFKVEI